MAKDEPDIPDWHKQLNRRIRRKRLKEVLSVAAVLLVILGVLAVKVDPYETVVDHRGTLAQVHLVDREHGPTTTKVSVRLESGVIVPVRAVPAFRQGVQVVVREEVSRIFRLHRYTFVSFEAQPSQ